MPPRRKRTPRRRAPQIRRRLKVTETPELHQLVAEINRLIHNIGIEQQEIAKIDAIEKERKLKKVESRDRSSSKKAIGGARGQITRLAKLMTTVFEEEGFDAGSMIDALDKIDDVSVRDKIMSLDDRIPRAIERFVGPDPEEEEEEEEPEPETPTAPPPEPFIWHEDPDLPIGERRRLREQEEEEHEQREIDRVNKVLKQEEQLEDLVRFLEEPPPPRPTARHDPREALRQRQEALAQMQDLPLVPVAEEPRELSPQEMIRQDEGLRALHMSMREAIKDSGLVDSSKTAKKGHPEILIPGLEEGQSLTLPAPAYKQALETGRIPLRMDVIEGATDRDPEDMVKIKFNFNVWSDKFSPMTRQRTMKRPYGEIEFYRSLLSIPISPSVKDKMVKTAKVNKDAWQVLSKILGKAYPTVVLANFSVMD